MRRIVLGMVVGLVVAVAGLGVAGSPAQAITRHECRSQWWDLVSLHGEDGNPGGPVAELSQRWDATYDAAQARAESATADDCGAAIKGYAEGWDELEGFMYDLYPYDPMGRLAIAEGDREHALHFHHLHHLSRPLERAFRTARKQAPLAIADLAPVMSAAPGVDVADESAVKAFVGDLRRTARASGHEHRLDRVLRLIGNAELDEE